MSTKAYDFYIMDKKNLNKYLLYTKQVMGLLLLGRFKKHPELWKVLSKGMFSIFEEYNKILPEITKEMQSPLSGDKDYLDLTCGISVWIWKEYAVVKPYGLQWILVSVMKQPRYVKDFHYQNQTDKPEDIDSKEWKRREKFFDKTVEDLPRMDYKPFDFLSREHFNALCRLDDLKRELEKVEK